jgi:D-aspartate ligase
VSLCRSVVLKLYMSMENIDSSVPVVVLQATPSLLHSGLGIARTLGRLGVKVYWVHDQFWSPASLSRYARQRFRWHADAPAEASVRCLLGWGADIGGRPILVPIDDASAVFVADHAEALRERFLFPRQPEGLVRTLSSKQGLYSLCKKMGVPTPEVVFPRSMDEVEEVAETGKFPVVLKRIAGWTAEARAAMSSVTIIQGPKELLREFKRVETPGEPNVMLQEYIPGGPESVWMFNGFFTESGQCLAAFTGKKIRQAPPFTGPTTLGVCHRNPTVEETAIDFMYKIGYSGIVDMDYLYDFRDGQYKLLDVNSRVGSTFRLFVDSNGMDVVRVLYSSFTGQSVRSGYPVEGRRWMVEQQDVISSLRYGRLGQLTLTAWIRSLRGVQETAWFARDDLVPFVAMCLTSPAALGRRLRRKRGLK